jgi:DNA-binding HxlR family transcriptional regulator
LGKLPDVPMHCRGVEQQQPSGWQAGNAALYAHVLDYFPSAFPMLHKGVAAHLRKQGAGLDEFIVIAQTVVVPRELIEPEKSEPAAPKQDQPAAEREPVFVSHQRDGIILAQLQRRDPVPQRQADLLGINSMPGSHLLSARLKALEAAGMVKSAPNRSGFVITPLGKALLGDLQSARTRS